jgi:exo-beta-1,3-glucanase (GH17 family)
MKPGKLLLLFLFTALIPTLLTSPAMNSITSQIEVNSDMTWASLQLHPNEDDGRTNIQFQTDSKMAEISNEAGEIRIKYDKSTLLTINHNSASTKLNVEYAKGLDIQGNLVINNKKQWVLAYRYFL